MRSLKDGKNDEYEFEKLAGMQVTSEQFDVLTVLLKMEVKVRIIKYRTELNENNHNILVKESATNYNMDNCDNPQPVVSMINDVFRLNKQAEEYVYLVALNTKNKVLGVFEVSHGSVNFSVMNPREIFIRALLVGASTIVLCHNHPSGETIPSEDDLKATRRIADCGELMNIPLLDHIIIADNDYKSLKASDLM